MPGLSVATYAVVVDKAWLEKLPEAHRKAVTDVMAEIAKRQWNEAIEEDKKMIAKMPAQGAVYRTADKAEIARWRAQAAPVTKSFTEKYPDVAKKMADLGKTCNAN